MSTRRAGSRRLPSSPEGYGVALPPGGGTDQQPPLPGVHAGSLPQMHAYQAVAALPGPTLAPTGPPQGPRVVRAPGAARPSRSSSWPSHCSPPSASGRTSWSPR
ncbi:hypothetical protein NKG05_00025 [Oerskovia sp. M15]